LGATFAIAAILFAVGEYLGSKKSDGIEKIRLYCLSVPAYLLKACR
jgi:hypothetical protein